MVDSNTIINRYNGKRVLITGHTGFKGAWLALMLHKAGARVCGYALKPNVYPSLYELLHLENVVESHIEDIRNIEKLKTVFDSFQPEYVFHLAAQPIVRESYRLPVETYETNVMGTVNLMECARQSASVKSVVNVTTDKVYLNRERLEGYTEDEMLDGFDPYSNSKSCSELVTHSYVRSFFDEKRVPVSTMRAGNVIGGGDFEKDRIIPDCVRAALAGRNIEVRNPNAVRPYQHVLEPLYAYVLVAMNQSEKMELRGAYNIGPDESDCLTTAELVDHFCKSWGENIKWENHEQVNAPHEANLLRLNCDKMKETFNWNPQWNASIAVEKTVEWVKTYKNGDNIRECMEKQIEEYLNLWR